MIMDFDRSLVRERNQELRREAQMRHLKKQLRTSREHRPAVRQTPRIWVRERKLAPSDQ